MSGVSKSETFYPVAIVGAVKSTIGSKRRQAAALELIWFFDRSDVWILPMAPGKPCAAGKPYPVLATPFNERQGVFSPDGLWVAYVSDESRRNEVFVAPFPGPGGKRQVSMAGGSVPRWSHDGKEIFYVGPDRRLMAAEVSVKDGALNVVQVRALSVPRIGRRFAYDVSLDSQKFLVPVAPEQSVSAPLTLVQNWTLGLKK